VETENEKATLLAAIRLWLQNQKTKAQDNQQNRTGDI